MKARGPFISFENRIPRSQPARRNNPKMRRKLRKFATRTEDMNRWKKGESQG